MKRIRDEAHRFAITHHRNIRAKVGLASQLDSVEGIGPSRRKALLKRFGTLDGIREASVEQLTAITDRRLVCDAAARSVLRPAGVRCPRLPPSTIPTGFSFTAGRPRLQVSGEEKR